MATASLAGCAALVAAAGLFGMVTRPGVPVGTTNRAKVRGLAEVRDVRIPPIRLRELSGGAAANSSRRNPFVFREQPAARPAARPRPSSLRPAAAPVVDPAPAPAIVLAGIAERQTTGGIARTALMIVGDGELTMAGIGQTIGADLTVEEIGADRVVIIDRLRRTRSTVLLGQPDL